MRVRFLRGFQSAHTDEQFYDAGVVADFAREHAQALIAEGAAEAVALVAREGQVQPQPPEMPPRVRQRGQRA
jgi:hypothetical protein